MPKIIWDESFSVHDVEIDNQHKKWIEITNELQDAIIQKKDSRTTTGKTLDKMVAYAQFHFSYEEAHLEKIKYPDLSTHQTIHSEFMGRLKRYQINHRTGKVVLSRDIMRELVDWLLNHILVEDIKYGDFLSDLKAKLSDPQ